MRFALLLMIAVIDCAIASERGSPVVEVYDSQGLEAAHISTDIAQLPDGRLVVVNMSGLLRFDGVRWEFARHPNAAGGMQHLALSPDGRIYTSFNGDIGYFLDDAFGQLQWHSLLDRLPIEHRHVGEVLDVSYDAGRRGIWITTFERAAFIPEGQGPARVIGPLERVHFGALVGEEYWIQYAPQDALGRIELSTTASLQPVPGAEWVRGHKLWAVTPGDGDFRLATSAGRLLRYRAGRLELWRDELQALYPQPGLRDLLRLRDGRYLIGSGEIGPVVLDAQGNLIDRYGEADGLPGRRRTHGLFQDRDGDLWLAQDRSIVKIGASRAVTVYDESRGLPSANDAERWQGRMYVSSTAGLYRMRAADGPGGGQFEHIVPQIIDLRTMAVLDEDLLLVGAGGGLYVLQTQADGELIAQRKLVGGMVSVLEASRFVARRVWLGHVGGVMRVDGDIGSAVVATPVAHIADSVTKIAEQDAHTLWVADRVDGVLRVDIDGTQPPRRYGPEQGLPAGQVRIYSGAQRVWFTTMLGLRVYDAVSDRFVVPANLPAVLSQDRLFSVLEDSAGNLWVRGGAIMNDLFWREGEQWRMDGQLMHVVEPNPTIFGFLREGDVVWAIRATGLLRFDLAAYQPLPAAPRPLLTQVYDLRAKAGIALPSLGELEPTRRDLRFNFALPVLHRPQATQYRSRLAGFDAGWSEWATGAANNRVFTNLPDGDFVFEVEARDATGRQVSLPTKTLRIAPPWWRSTTARIAYLAAAVFALWIASRLGARRRQRQLLVRQRELEAIVAARTQELKHSNAQLAEQAERLTEVDRLKTRFFINVGHEFRTPLSLVLGPIDDLLRDARERISVRAREQLEMANRNARRVLDLIVELLDVNRFEHGQMRLTRVPTDVRALAQRILVDHAALLERHGHHSKLDIGPGDAWLAAIDPPQIERCVSNLIGNAAKYMARGGNIELRLRRHGDEIELALLDQGRGISAAALPHVYDRFFQAEGSDSASGYGIGLALVREIVEAHQGRVGVESELGVGSVFSLTLPALDTSAVMKAFPAAPVVELHTAGAAPTDPVASEDDASVARGRPLVLVVDDHDDLRARVRGLMEARFDVIEAADGPVAWNLVRDRLPDLIVCDVMMPGFDGIELTRRLRADADTAAIALLLLTAKVGSEHAVAGLRAGADDYLAKPFDASELLARVDALLARAQRLRLRLSRERAPPPTPPAGEGADQRWRRRLDELIALRLDDPELSVEQLAEGLHSDRSQLFRKCKELLGMSPSEYLRDTRLKRSHGMLEERAGSISEIAYAVGFDSLSSFTRAFKARYAIPPSGVSTRKAG